MDFSDGAFEYDTGHSDEDCGQRIVSFPERIGLKVRMCVFGCTRARACVCVRACVSV